MVTILNLSVLVFVSLSLFVLCSFNYFLAQVKLNGLGYVCK